MLCPSNKLKNEIALVKCRSWGSLFKAATICPEVVERPFDKLMVMSLSKDRHQNQNALDSSPTEQGYLSAYPSLCLSSIPLVAAMEAVTSNVVWWVANLKRNPHDLLDFCKYFWDTTVEAISKIEEWPKFKDGERI